MKINTIISDKDIKISFFDNIFYWLWHYTPERGLPDRSFGIISISQFACFMFCISLILNMLNDKMIVVLYEIDTKITIIPLVFVFIFILLFFVNMKIYNEQKYLILKELYVQMNRKQKSKYKKTFFIYFIVIILVAVIAIKMLILYADNIPEIVNQYENQ
jgi:hypothetical protein